MILEEFDDSKEAMIQPSEFAVKVEGMPKIAITCFEGKAFRRLVSKLGGKQIAVISNTNADFPIYKIQYKGQDVAFYMSDMCAAGAGMMLDKIYAMGVERVIVYGSCGVLDKELEDCSIIIPNRAVRDEGISYHYAPPSDEIDVNPKFIPEFTRLLENAGYEYTIGKVWTTDAFFRETETKVKRRKAAGCICVDMECSAMAAVAQFREKDIFHFFYAEDNLDAKVWEKRSLGSDERFTKKDEIARLAFEFAVRGQ